MNKHLLFVGALTLLLNAISINGNQEKKGTIDNIKILVLIIASDDLPVYIGLQKIWRSYMHYNPKQVEAYFIKGDPNLTSTSMIIDDVIWCKSPENFNPGMINKTILSMEALLPRIKTEFDYVLRTNLSSFYVFDRLLNFLETIPKKNVYCGSHNGDPIGLSGSGFLLSKDMVELLIQYKTLFYNNSSFPEDVLVSDFFKSHLALARFFVMNRNIPPILHERMNFYSLEDWNKSAHDIPNDIFHFRIKTNDHLRIKHDIYIHSQLLKMFYPGLI